MSDHTIERSQRLAALYLQLANQLPHSAPRDTLHRLLLLAARHACDAGWHVEANLCQECVRRDNPRHLVSRFPTMPAALLSADYLDFERQLKRQCPQERAEHLAEVQRLDDPAVTFDSPLRAARHFLERLSLDEPVDGD
ncbi:MAG: hypothetical protein QF363_19705 [Planctomycetaceae bacterium]|jgi:hypothetical protein|nr:hypothetical protein [Planctomycetaceae bacterium]